MTTSPRRFVRHGVIRQLIYDMLLLTADRVGAPSAAAHAWYNRHGR